MDVDVAVYNEQAELLKALAHPLRLCIVRGLIQKNGCNVTHMQDCLNAPQSTISQHLQKLRMAGIVQGERNGTEIRYRVCNENVIRLIAIFFPQ